VIADTAYFLGEDAARGLEMPDDPAAADYRRPGKVEGGAGARIRAVLRRARPGRPPLSAAGVLRSGRLRFDRLARRAWLGERELTATPKALTLLDYLLTHPDELLTRERLLDVLWGFTNPVGTRAVDNRVAELRRLLDDDPAAPTWIETVAGLGYRFCGQVEAGA